MTSAARRLRHRVRPWLRRAYGRWLDVTERFRSPPDASALPVHLLTAEEARTYHLIGDNFLSYFVDLAGLEPSHAILEVGSGAGRMALPLTRYLTTGSYDGFDVMPEAIRWCRRAISSRFERFRFQVADIWNAVYNPIGRHSASSYRFPYGDGQFDLVFLTSVFTHLVPADMENYFREIARVLKPGGRCLITFFLLNPVSRERIVAGQSSIRFAAGDDRQLTVTGEADEYAIAFDEAYVLDLFAANGLRVDPPIHYGNWCGCPQPLDYQDIVVATKS